MTRTLAGSAEYRALESGQEGTGKGRSQAGWSPKGRAFFLRTPFLNRFPDHLFHLFPPFTLRLLLPSTFMVPILEVPCGLYPSKLEIFLAPTGRSRPKASSGPDSVTNPRLRHAS